jgi:hypothetical protein
MGHRSCWLFGLVFAVGGLLLMHGLDAPGHVIAADDHTSVVSAADDTAMSGDATASAAISAADGTAHHGVLGHVLVMCGAVLAVAACGRALRRLSLRPLAVPAVTRAAARWAHRALGELPLSGADRLALCILRV